MVMVKVGDHREGWRRAARQWWLSCRGWTLTPWKCWGLEPASVLVGDILVVLLTGRKTRHSRHALSGSALVFVALF